MKIKNSTDYPDHFLRRLVSWCCRQLDIPVRSITKATFRNRMESYSGHCKVSSGEIVVSIRRPWDYPIHVFNRPLNRVWAEKYDDPVSIATNAGGGVMVGERADMLEKAESLRLNDPENRLLTLVKITAHEIAHRMNYLEESRTRGVGTRGLRPGQRRMVSGGSEKNTNMYERKLLAAFTADQSRLIEAWLPEPKRPEPKMSRQERNERSVRDRLAKWERKLKTSQRKCRELRAKARYYDRIAAKRSGA